MTGPRRRLDELDAAHLPKTREYGCIYVNSEDYVALTSALRAVADLADQWEAEAKRHDDAEPVTTQDLTRTILAAKHCRAHARDLRAALAPLAAPDTADETT